MTEFCFRPQGTPDKSRTPLAKSFAFEKMHPRKLSQCDLHNNERPTSVLEPSSNFYGGGLV